MTITIISSDQIIRTARVALAINVSGVSELSEEALSGMVRRAACSLCPCSPATLINAVFDCLEYIEPNKEVLRERIQDAVEGLTVLGDLLELSQVTVDEDTVKGTWLFAAPSSFVRKTDGVCLLLGMAGEKPLPLPSTFNPRIRHERYSRTIQRQADEDLPQVLHDFGLTELSESTWLRAPKEQTAEKLIGANSDRLAAQSSSGEVTNLEILDPETSITYYNGRWQKPASRSGLFVARRPQQYGAPIWGFASLNKGDLVKFLDFPFGAGRNRGCDMAWHLQMAVDRARNKPQVYKVVRTEGGAFLDFFSPIPAWARRRLEAFGKPQSRSRCLFSYLLPLASVPIEEKFLQTRLWMSPITDTD